MKYLIVLLVLLIAACSVDVGSLPHNPAKNEGADIRYFEDTRTGLCFAEIGAWVEVGTQKEIRHDSHYYSFTNVPCQLEHPRGHVLRVVEVK